MSASNSSVYNTLIVSQPNQTWKTALKAKSALDDLIDWVQVEWSCKTCYAKCGSTNKSLMFITIISLSFNLSAGGLISPYFFPQMMSPIYETKLTPTRLGMQNYDIKMLRTSLETLHHLMQ